MRKRLVTESINDETQFLEQKILFAQFTCYDLSLDGFGNF